MFGMEPLDLKNDPNDPAQTVRILKVTGQAAANGVRPGDYVVGYNDQPFDGE